MAEDWVAAKNKTCLLSIRTLDLAEELAVVPLMAYSLAPRLSLPIATAESRTCARASARFILPPKLACLEYYKNNTSAGAGVYLEANIPRRHSNKQGHGAQPCEGSPSPTKPAIHSAKWDGRKCNEI